MGRWWWVGVVLFVVATGALARERSPFDESSAMAARMDCEGALSGLVLSGLVETGKGGCAVIMTDSVHGKPTLLCHKGEWITLGEGACRFRVLGFTARRVVLLSKGGKRFEVGP